MEREDRKEEIKWEHKRKSENAQKNNSSVKYDLVTLESKNEKDREDEQCKKNFAHVCIFIVTNILAFFYCLTLFILPLTYLFMA